MIDMTDRKLSKWKEKHLERKTKRRQKWKEHFRNLFGNPLEITNKLQKKNFYSQLDIKLGQFTKEEIDAILKKIKSRKTAGLN